MADEVYRVRIEYKPDTAEAERATSRLEGGFGRLKDLVVGAAAAFGISKLAGKIFELGSQAEDTRIAIAGMMQAGGAAGLTNSAEDFAKAMGMSGAIMTQMRKDARDLPGEFEDLVNVFRGSLGGGFAAGQTTNQIEHMAARVMAVSKTLGIDSVTAGREMAMMMEGRAGAHNALFMRLHNQIKMTGQEFNALTAEKKWAKIDEALRGYDPAVKAFGNTWSAVESTTEDYLKQLLRVGSAPIFEMVKRHLGDWNAWFEKNQASIEEMATTLGTKLAHALETSFGVLRDTFNFVVAHKDTLIKIAEAYAVFKVGGALGGGALFGGVTSRGIGPGGGPGPSFGQVAAGAAFGVMLDQLAGESNTLTTAFHGLYGALGTLPGPIGLVAGSLNLLFTALQAVAAKIDEWHKEKVTSEGDVRSLTELLHGKGVRNAEVAERAIFNRSLELGAVSRTGHLDAKKFQDALIARGVSNGVELTFLAKSAAAAIDALPIYDRMKKLGLTPSVEPGGGGDPFQALLNKKTTAHQVVNITNNNHIVQTIENANDPDRVLVKTREALEQIFRHETVSPTNRFATLR